MKKKKKNVSFFYTAPICLQDSLIIDLALKPQLFTCVAFRIACSF